VKNLRSDYFLVYQNDMKLLYFANIRLPTEKAHGIQIMNMCEAFARANVDVSLIVPRRYNAIKKNPFEYYDVEQNFKIVRLLTVDFLFLPFLKKAWFFIENVVFTIASFLYVISKKEQVVCYTRDILIAFFLFSRRPVFYEIHTLPKKISSVHRLVFKRVRGLVVISNGLKKDLTSLGVDESKIFLAPDGVDLQQFSTDVSKEKCRQQLNIRQDKKMVLYTGHLYAWKGVDTLIEAAKKLDADTLLYIVGGTNEDVQNAKSKTRNAKNIIFAGHRQHQEIPLWLKAADVLVLPTSGKEKIGREYTSPMKLFEYMTSGTPIIAADTLSIREILDETTSFFFEADNPNDLSEKIGFVFAHSDTLNIMAEKAQKVVKEYSWSNRTENILFCIKNMLNTKKIILPITSDEITRKYKETIVFSKTDFWRTCVIGEAIAILAIPVLQNLKVFEILALHNGGFLLTAIGLWLLLLPFAVVVGLYFAYRLGLWWRPSIFQVGKYGLIGVLNTFLSVGILNLFIWITDIARGPQFIVFTIIAFAITITHSFFWNKFWTFQAHDTKSGKTEYVRFFTITSATSLLNIFLLHIIVNVIGAPIGIDPKIWVNIAFAALIPIAFLGNFFGYKIFVFKRLSL
jgi:glycosyltransferase involved in cell wall biosynthesis/putative flippase GtrA